MSTFCPRKSKNANSNIFLFAAAGGDFSSLFFWPEKDDVSLLCKKQVVQIAAGCS